MGTINDLSVVSSVSPSDKVPVWSSANGVTRGLPISVLDGRYLSVDDVAALAASATVESFISDTLPNPLGLPTFTAGSTLGLTLKNQYYSAANIEVFFDAAFQGPDQYQLVGYGLAFISQIPLGVQNVYVRGGAIRQIGAPSSGTVTDDSIAAGAGINSSKLSFIQNGIFAVTRTVLAKLRESFTPQDFGAKGDGVNDDTAACQTALAALKTFGGGRLHFPAGKYKLSAQLSYTCPGLSGGISFTGDGADVTVLEWSNSGGGIQVNYSSPGHSSHFRDMTLQTTRNGGGNGLHLFQSMSLNNFMQTDIFNVTMRGADGAAGTGGTNYWNNCAFIEGVCGTNWDSITCYSDSGRTGSGLIFRGNLAQVANDSAGNGYSIYHNVSKSTFNGLSLGIEYGSYAQGLTITQINAQNTTTGISTPAGATGVLSQLQVSDSQFACTGNNIVILTNIGNCMIHDNDIFVINGNSGILLAMPEGYSLIGNNIANGGDSSAMNGIAIGPPYVPGQQGVIMGNVFTGLHVGVLLQTGSSGNNVQSNVYPGCANAVDNLGTGNTIGGGSQ